MSKRYKGKDTHYRLQIKKDGEWQDLGLVASAEMDNKNVDDTTTTNFDEKYIHKNNDKNDWDSKDQTDIKTTDLTFQTSTLGRTPKIMFENTDASTKDLAEIYLDTQEANKSTLRFVVGDDKGGESAGNNETISFDWRNGEENSRATYYTFTESKLQATKVTATFAAIQSNTYNNSNGTKMLNFSVTGEKWETNIYNGQAGKDSTLSIWGSNHDNTAEASIQYRNQAEDESWTVGVNTGGTTDNAFAWYSHQSAAGNRMWLTHDGELHLQDKIVLRPDNRPAEVHASTTPLTLYDDAINFHHENDSAWIGFPTADGEKSTFEFGISDDGISDGDLGDKIQFAWYDTTGRAQSKIFIPKENGEHTLATQEHVSDRYLPLAGGTMSGEIYFSCSDGNVQYYGLNWSKDENTLHLFSELQNEQLTLKISDGTNTIRFNRASMSFNDKSTISFNDIDQCLDFLF